ncbi:hypothetical protein [Microbulbifer sp. PSTR4-B]|uniref:hypothetical protein n=1 Tax=Microbulbifer sp. PSTR4-B TaxID=3243396 RepID=UPI0040392A3A
MLNPNNFENEVSPASRKVLGVACTLIGLALALSAWLTGEIVVVILSFVAGLPVGLVGLSLLFGKAKRGNGIFSSLTLYVIGSLIALASVVGVYNGQPKTGFGVLVAFGCFALARKRSN